jgi:hypothetical protein
LRDTVEEKKELDIFFNNENQRISVISKNQYLFKQNDEYEAFMVLDSGECLDGVNESLNFMDVLSHTGGEEKNFR